MNSIVTTNNNNNENDNDDYSDNDNTNDRVDLMLLINNDENYIDKLIESLSNKKNFMLSISTTSSTTTISISIIDTMILDDEIIDNIKSLLIKLDVRSLQLASCLSEYNKQYSNNYNISNAIPPFDYIYTNYNADLLKYFSMNSKVNIGYDHHPILSNEIIRIQIIMNMLMNESHFHDIQRTRLLIDTFPPHRHLNINIGISTNILKIKSKELKELRDYFSDYFACKIALVLSIIRWLLVPSIISIIITLLTILHINLSFIASIGLPLYSIIMMKFIKRNFNKVLLEFGILEKINSMRLNSRAEPTITDNTDVNTNFKGILKLSEINNTSTIISYSPSNKRILRTTISYLFTLLLMISCKIIIFIIFVIGIVILRSTGSHHQSISFIIILNAIQTLLIPNQLISKICYYLTDIENNRTNLEFNISMNCKLFFIDAVNTIIPSILLSLLQQQLCYQKTVHCTAGLSYGVLSTIILRSSSSLINAFGHLKQRNFFENNYTQLEDQLLSHPNFAKSSHMLINSVTNIGFIIIFTGSNPIILPFFTLLFTIEISMIIYNSIHYWRRICSTTDEMNKVFTVDLYIELLSRLINPVSLIVSSSIYFFTSNLINVLNLQLRTILFIIYILLVYLINELYNAFIADIPRECNLHIIRSQKIIETLLNSVSRTSTNTSIEEEELTEKIHNDCSNSMLSKVKTYHIGISTSDVRKTVSSYLQMYGDLIDEQKETSVYDDDKCTTTINF